MPLRSIFLGDDHLNALRDDSGQEDAWISPEIIDAFAMTLLPRIDPMAFVILTASGALPNWYGGIDASTRNTRDPIILAPVLDLKSNHWVLVVVNCSHKVISCVSSGVHNARLLTTATNIVKRSVLKLQKQLPDLVEIPWDSKAYRQKKNALIQENNSDCGVHVCINMMRVLGLSHDCEPISNPDKMTPRQWLERFLVREDANLLQSKASALSTPGPATTPHSYNPQESRAILKYEMTRIVVDTARKMFYVGPSKTESTEIWYRYLAAEDQKRQGAPDQTGEFLSVYKRGDPREGSRHNIRETSPSFQASMDLWCHQVSKGKSKTKVYRNAMRDPQISPAVKRIVSDLNKHTDPPPNRYLVIKSQPSKPNRILPTPFKKSRPFALVPRPSTRPEDPKRPPNPTANLAREGDRDREDATAHRRKAVESTASTSSMRPTGQRSTKVSSTDNFLSVDMTTTYATSNRAPTSASKRKSPSTQPQAQSSAKKARTDHQKATSSAALPVHGPTLTFNTPSNFNFSEYLKSDQWWTLKHESLAAWRDMKRIFLHGLHLDADHRKPRAGWDF